MKELEEATIGTSYSWRINRYFVFSTKSIILCYMFQY